MPRLGEIFESKYLSASDIDDELTVTIEHFDMVEVTNEGKKEQKPCLHFQETDKPMILNKTNAKTIADVLRSDDTDDWIGQRITLFATTVESFGKMSEAIRVKMRPPKPAQQAQGAAARQQTAQSVRQAPPAQQHQSSAPDDPFGDNW